MSAVGTLPRCGRCTKRGPVYPLPFFDSLAVGAQQRIHLPSQQFPERLERLRPHPAALGLRGTCASYAEHQTQTHKGSSMDRTRQATKGKTGGMFGSGTGVAPCVPRGVGAPTDPAA
eukprot:3941871-Rhodomonas_salina.2